MIFLEKIFFTIFAINVGNVIPLRVLLGIFGGGMQLWSPNPHPISDLDMAFSGTLFQTRARLFESRLTLIHDLKLTQVFRSLVKNVSKS